MIAYHSKGTLEKIVLQQVGNLQPLGWIWFIYMGLQLHLGARTPVMCFNSCHGRDKQWKLALPLAGKNRGKCVLPPAHL